MGVRNIRSIIAWGFILGIGLGTAQVYGQQAQEKAAAEETSSSSWVWGKLADIDIKKDTFTLRTMDLFSGKYKDMVFSIEKTVVLENFKSLSDLTPGKGLSVVYYTNEAGENTATSLRLITEASEVKSP